MPIFKNVYNSLVDIYNSLWQRVSKTRGKNIRLDAISDFIVDLAKSYTPYKTGSLYDSIGKKPTSDGLGYIISIYGKARKYGRFVEYGTGIRGKNNPHPEPPSSWKYNAYFDEHGVDWTGFEPRAFMYRTFLYMINALRNSEVNSRWYTITFTSIRRNPAIIIKKR